MMAWDSQGSVAVRNVVGLVACSLALQGCAIAQVRAGLDPRPPIASAQGWQEVTVFRSVDRRLSIGADVAPARHAAFVADAAFPLDAASPPNHPAPSTPAPGNLNQSEPDPNLGEQTGATPSEPEAEPAAEPSPASDPAGAASTAVPQQQLDLTGNMSSEPDPSEDEPEKPKLRRMVWDLSMRFGGTFGADDLLVAEYSDGSTQTLTTGGGVNFFLGTNVTPFKVGSHALTFGFEGGWKSSWIGEGSDTDITFSRKAFMPRVQYGYDIVPGIVWITGGGAQYETDIELEATGAFYGSTKVDDALGAFGETGVLLDVGVFGLDLTFRHTWITYRSPGLPSLDGSSFGIFISLRIGLLKTENTRQPSAGH